MFNNCLPFSHKTTKLDILYLHVLQLWSEMRSVQILFIWLASSKTKVQILFNVYIHCGLDEKYFLSCSYMFNYDFFMLDTWFDSLKNWIYAEFREIWVADDLNKKFSQRNRIETFFTRTNWFNREKSSFLHIFFILFINSFIFHNIFFSEVTLTTVRYVWVFFFVVLFIICE